MEQEKCIHVAWSNLCFKWEGLLVMNSVLWRMIQSPWPCLVYLLALLWHWARLQPKLQDLSSGEHFYVPYLEITLLFEHDSFSTGLLFTSSSAHSCLPPCLITLFCFFIFLSFWEVKCSLQIPLCSFRDCLTPSQEPALPSSRPLSFFLPQIICCGSFYLLSILFLFFFFLKKKNLPQVLTILHRQYAICISYLHAFFSFKWG